jgi:hypothetical protein
MNLPPEWQEWDDSADGTSTPRDGVSTAGVSGVGTPTTSGPKLKLTFNGNGSALGDGLTNGLDD